MRIIGGQEIPEGVIADSEGAVSCELIDNATLADALAQLKLPDEVLTLVDSSSIARADRAGKMLHDGDEVIVFPALKGG